MMTEAEGPLFCAVEADGVTWHHQVTGQALDNWDGPAVVVAGCADHPWPATPRTAVVDFTWPDRRDEEP